MKRALTLGLAVGLIAATFTAGKVAHASGESPASTIPPVRLLDARVSGKAALAAANSKGVLAQVAALARTPEATISNVLSTDESATLDVYGNLGFVEPTYDPILAAAAAAQTAPTVPITPSAKKIDPGLSTQPQNLSDGGLAKANESIGSAVSAVSGPTATGSMPTPVGAPFPYADTFALHSRPGATKVIYLDFDGYTTTAAGSNFGDFVGTAFNLDSTAGFSNAEQDAIQSIWQRVSEDYSVFDVDVTTQDPGFAAIDRSGAADLNYGTRVAIVSNTVTTPICASCGGWAYFNAFDMTVNHSRFQPAWVFQNSLASVTKYMAEASSHESGHHMNLFHDGCTAAGIGNCTASDLTYYAGHANWAPIMGNSYYRPVSQWSNGEYLGANNTQDDTAIIASKVPFIADETNTSFAVAQGIGSLAATGLISNASDFDYFRYAIPTAGTYQITVTPGGQPGSVSPNLDLRLSVYEGAAAGSFIAQDEPVSTFQTFDLAGGMGAGLLVNFASSGAKYFTVDSAQTDSSGDNGYSFYGSIGQYTVQVTPVTPSGDSFVPVADTRLLDTRPNPVAAGSTINLQVAGGLSPVPASATAVVLNVAAVAPPSSGHIRVFPTGTPLPNASVVNFTLGKNTPNQVIVKVGTGGSVTLYAGGTTNMIVDISGYFTTQPDGAYQYVPILAPYATTLGTLTIPALGTSNVQVRGAGGVPGINGPGVTSKVALNVAVLDPTSTGHIRVYPAGGVVPPTSTNNFVVGDSRTNLVVTAYGNNGQVSIYNTTTAPVTVRVDTVGYFSTGGLGFVPVTPVRPLDTRVGGGPPVVSGGFREVQIRGFGPVPNSPDVKAVAVNVAAVNPTLAGTFSGGPSGAVTLLESLIHPANENVANLMILPIGADGNIRITNTMAFGGTSHMIVDITGFFTD
jgi:hypothetical protein